MIAYLRERVMKEPLEGCNPSSGLPVFPAEHRYTSDLFSLHFYCILGGLFDTTPVGPRTL